MRNLNGEQLVIIKGLQLEVDSLKQQKQKVKNLGEYITTQSKINLIEDRIRGINISK